MTKASRGQSALARGARVLTAVLVLPLGACSSMLMDYAPGPSDEGPTVVDLENHIGCEIQNVMRPPHTVKVTPTDQKLLDTLANYNFVGTAQVSVGVTDNGAFNPSLSFINPTHVAGGGLSNTLNKTFGIGGQATGLRDRTYTFAYNVDFATVKSANASVDYCAKDVMKGSLDLAQVLSDGVGSIDATASTNYVIDAHDADERAQLDADLLTLQTQIAADRKMLARDAGFTGATLPAGEYGALQSAYADSVTAYANVLGRMRTDAPETADDKHFDLNEAARKLVKSSYVFLKTDFPRRIQELRPPPPTSRGGLRALTSSGPGGAGVKAPGKAGAPSPTASTYFSSQIDFNLTLGLNGGANWTLTHFKGPTGSGGSLLSFSRQRADSIQISFAPTCITRLEAEGDVPRSWKTENYWESLPPCTSASAAQLKTDAITRLQEYQQFSIPQFQQELRRALGGS